VSGGFSDYFSEQAATYAAARPRYPDALYERIAAVSPRRSLAWDCATGNGQAARDLAKFFTRVIATDASAEQIARATPVPNVDYRVALAEASGLFPGTCDLVTVAQALHWLDLERFYAEVRRVTPPDGIIAAWAYGSCGVTPEMEPLLREFEHGTLGPCWPPNRRWVDEGYRTIPFPFAEIAMPSFELRVIWTLGQLGQYLRSWSAVGRYRQEHGQDPVTPFLERLQHHWGDPDRPREVTWPLSLRVGRIT
jgi:SAM-dependent methyltransferase